MINFHGKTPDPSIEDGREIRTDLPLKEEVLVIGQQGVDHDGKKAFQAASTKRFRLVENGIHCFVNT